VMSATGTHAFTITDCETSVKCANCNVMSTAGVHTPDGAHALLCTDSDTCEFCDYDYENASAHAYIYTLTAGICGESGAKVTAACSLCGYSEANVDASSHIPGPDATCGEAKKCLTVDCDYVFEAALGHDMDWVLSGTDCGDSVTATGTCQRDGCGYTDTISKINGHFPGAAATCAAPQTCVACGYVITSALGHNWGPWVLTSADGTCGTDSAAFKRTCARCGEIDTDASSVTVDNHIPGAAATCTVPQTCLVCGGQVAPALGHVYGTAWETNATHHWHVCSRGCGIKGDEAAHVDDDSDGLCDDCDYNMAAPACACESMHGHKLGLAHRHLFDHNDGSVMGKIECFLCRLWHWIPFLFLFGWIWMWF